MTLDATLRHESGPPSPAFAILRTPRELLFGAGQRHALRWVAPRYGKRAIVFADSFLVGTDEFEDLLARIAEGGVTTEVYSDVRPELPVSAIPAALQAATDAAADMIIAIGGGSSIDLAKVVAVLMTHGGPVQRYYGEFAVPGPVLPLIAVPTTAGTGSEVTPVAVLTDGERATKVGISSPHIIPTVAVCDPELTLTCPGSVTLASGVDALSHCIESYTATRREPHSDLARERVFVGKSAITDELALAGIRSIVAGLERALAQPDDLDARTSVMYGALLGGIAFGTAGTAAAHALQYPVGAATHTPHGIGVGVLLPAVMAYNTDARIEEMAAIAAAFGGSGTTEQLAAAASALVAEYLSRIGVPEGLGALGFPADRLEWAAAEGLASARLSENNPRPLSVEGAHQILTAAYAPSTVLS